MQLVYTLEDIPETFTKSCFLVGPSCRPDQKDIESWRPEAIQYLMDNDYDGVVFVPEYRDPENAPEFDLAKQIEWEDSCLNASDCILCWVPRDLETLPAFTTNIEFGTWQQSGKIVFGAPKDAPKNDYIKYYCKKYNVPTSDSLEETVKNAIKMIGPGAERSSGERFVPYFIWKTDSFQSWYKAQTSAGNRLDNARLSYSFRPGYKDFTFLWILQADIFIQSENRHKTNEFVLSRPDISSILLYKKEDNINDTEIVIIKEFRTPAATSDGFIRELIGGSSKESDNPEEIAAEEVFEETAFVVEPERLKYHQTRQLAGTLSSHKSHFYSVEITEEELKWFKSQKDIVHGKEEDTERTFIEIYTVKELLEKEDFDWATLGQVFLALNDNN